MRKEQKPSSGDFVAVTLRLPKETAAVLHDAAGQMGLSPSQLMVRAFDLLNFANLLLFADAVPRGDAPPGLGIS